MYSQPRLRDRSSIEEARRRRAAGDTMKGPRDGGGGRGGRGLEGATLEEDLPVRAAYFAFPGRVPSGLRTKALVSELYKLTDTASKP